MLLKEYRICMPLSVEEYKIGQLYMIAKHSHEQSDDGEGVEVVKNEPIEDPKHGKGQYTEKRVHLSSKLPTWMKSMVPNIFYITEKAWNYYPYTITEYSCSFVPRYTIHIETRYENNAGTTENCLDLPPEELAEREVDHIDIALDEVPEHKYKEEEDPTKFKSQKTGRGPLAKDWKDVSDPLMCSYKAVKVKFEVWGLQTRVEGFTHRSVRDILLLGHKQAFTWMDEWFGMTMDDIRKYEKEMAKKTNEKIGVSSTEDPNIPSHEQNSSATTGPPATSPSAAAAVTSASGDTTPSQAEQTAS